MRDRGNPTKPRLDYSTTPTILSQLKSHNTEARMNQQANQNFNRVNDSAIKDVIDSQQKKHTKTISASPEAYSVSIFAYARNTFIGMALAYIDRLDSMVRPVLFCATHLGVFIAATLHLLAPLSLAWFASHWSERMENTVWVGNFFSQTVSFATLWIFALIAWSILWLGFRMLFGKLRGAATSFATTGDAYLSKALERERNHRSGQPKPG